MNTPTHLFISIAALTRREKNKSRDTQEPTSTNLIPASLGALLPDVPMFAFYAIEKLLVGSTEREIWETRYFLPGWQDFFDVCNSIPICLVGIAIALALKKRFWVVLFCSMLLHCLFDLPVHHDDGHRHFWPFSNWRFASPVSYWDPMHFGVYGAAIEFVLTLACFGVSLRRHERPLTRWLLTILFALYSTMAAGYFVFVLARANV